MEQSCATAVTERQTPKQASACQRNGATKLVTFAPHQLWALCYSEMSPSPAPSRSSHKDSPSTPGLPSGNFIPEPVSHVVSTLYRRLTEPLSPPPVDSPRAFGFDNMPSVHHPSGVFPAPKRTESPFNPPPLTSLTLHPCSGPASPTAPLSPGSTPNLTRTLAEEIRLLLPPRLQLATDWRMIYSIDHDGVSLATLYHKCAPYRNVGASSVGRGGFVLVIRDGAGGVFGAFLTDVPSPQPHYYGTGECFLWRATTLPASVLLANLPLPPSADTTNMQRSTTIGGEPRSPRSPQAPVMPNGKSGSNGRVMDEASGTSTPNRIRFKAFPYSGINDYMIFCEPDYLSVGGGDGHYGLWLDSSLERGISSHCLTFGNETLSEEGEKFEVIGVEIWAIGN